MQNRVWRIGTRAAVAVVAGVMAITASSVPAVASPAPAADPSNSLTISLSQGPFSVISPDARVRSSLKALGRADTVTAFHGFSTFRSIKIESQGFDLEGRIKGRLKSHNFEKVYQVYNVPKSSSWGVWVVKFKQDTSQGVLKQTFQREELIDVNIDIKFKVSAAALRNVSTLKIGFETLRLELDGTTKDFTVVNGASGGAEDQNGNDIPVDFEPV
jgi:hypothetical protein